ncbi:MAG: FAD:protein FMN transferase [Treponema sp.]|nr:FAD:protein FMN transferase [Treponema sp.]MCL2191247.1 FAD:protein FMN transferase [Treponema sp.]
MAIKPRGFLAAFLLSFFLPSCESEGHLRVEFALGTICVVSLFDCGNDQLYNDVFSRIREIDRTMTAFSAPVDGGSDSYVVEIGRRAGIAPVRVGADLIDVLERALYFAEISGGAFDPTIGPLTGLWGIGTGTLQRVPGDAEIAAALDLVNWRDLEIDREAGTVFLRRPGMSLDLGSIAKGYAGDEAARIAREAGVRRALIDLGGNIVVVGRRRQGRDDPWRIGLQNPLGGRGGHLGVLEVYDTSVVTSGVNERFFVVQAPDGTTRRYHHLLSTVDGFPVENGLLSVTVVTKSSTDADALSTAAFALGYERGRSLVDSMPGFEAIFVFDDRRVKTTDGLARVFRLTDGEFTLVP